MSSSSDQSVTLVHSMGEDRTIIEAARMSTAKGFLGWDARICDCCVVNGDGDLAASDPSSCQICGGTGQLKGDEKLLEYLYRNGHLTPFEMCEAVFEVHCPIFVAREWMRHRTFSYNEMSGRYIELPNEYYAPRMLRKQSTANKQGGADIYMDGKVQWGIEEEQSCAHELYLKRVESGMEKGLARLNLPVALMTRFRVKGNLRNWMHFMHLRCAPNALFEIRVCANEIRRILTEKFPRTMWLWEEYTFEAKTLSRSEWERVKKILDSQPK